MSVFEGSRLLRGKPGHEGHADDHSRQRRRSARGRARAREESPGRCVTSRLIGIDGLHPRSRRSAMASSTRSEKHAADLTKAGAKTLIVDVRRAAEGPFENGIAAARAFVKSGTLGDQGGPRQAASRARRSRRERATARSICRSRCWSRRAPSGAAELFAAALERQRPRAN